MNYKPKRHILWWHVLFCYNLSSFDSNTNFLSNQVKMMTFFIAPHLSVTTQDYPSFRKQCVCVCVCAHRCLVMSDSLATPWPVALQVPLSMEFSRQEYRRGCHFLLQGVFPTQGSNPGLPHCTQILYRLSTREAQCTASIHQDAVETEWTLQALLVKAPLYVQLN